MRLVLGVEAEALRPGWEAEFIKLPAPPPEDFEFAFHHGNLYLLRLILRSMIDGKRGADLWVSAHGIMGVLLPEELLTDRIKAAFQPDQATLVPQVELKDDPTRMAEHLRLFQKHVQSRKKKPPVLSKVRPWVPGATRKCKLLRLGSNHTDLGVALDNYFMLAGYMTRWLGLKTSLRSYRLYVMS